MDKETNLLRSTIMKLYLIRHGQTDWNVLGKIQGSYDCCLNDTGITQAKQLSEKIIEANYKFSKIYSSQQKRALKTAQILSEAIKVEFVPMHGLEEVKFGEWEGLTWKEIQEQFPIEYDEWFNNRRYTRPPKGESYEDMLQRVLAVIHKIVNMEVSDTAVVTHGAVIMCILCCITNTPFAEMMKFKADNTTIIEIDSEKFNFKKNNSFKGEENGIRYNKGL